MTDGKQQHSAATAGPQGLSAEDQAFVGRAVQWLDQGNAQLDAATLSRLNQVRHRALDGASASRGWLKAPFGMHWASMTGAAAAVMLAVVIWPGTQSPAPSLAGPGLFDDLEIVMAEDSLEMLEDLEFYEWLSVDGPEAENI